MSFEDELRKIQQERKTAPRNVQTTPSKTQVPQQKPLSQKDIWIRKNSPTICSMLSKMAATLWGENSYTLVVLDCLESPTWYVVHERGDVYSFQVTLVISHRELDDNLFYELHARGYSSEKIQELATLDRPKNNRHFYGPLTIADPTGFEVKGQKTFSCGLSQSELRDALLKAFESGPQKNDLNKEARELFQKSPYKKGEWASGGWLFILGMVLTVFVGFYFIFAKHIFIGSSQVVAVIALFLLIIASLIVTRLGSRFQRLSGWRRAIAWGSIIPGGLAVLVLGGFILLIIVVCAGWMYGQAAKEVVPVVTLNSRDR